MDQAQDKLLRIGQVAERLDCSEKKVRRMIGEDLFRCCMVRGSVRVWQSSVEGYLKRITELWDKENGILE